MSVNKIKEMESLRIASSSNQGLRFSPRLHKGGATEQAFVVKGDAEEVKDPKATTIDGMENFDTDNMYEYTEESKPVSVIMTHEYSN